MADEGNKDNMMGGGAENFRNTGGKELQRGVRVSKWEDALVENEFIRKGGFTGERYGEEKDDLKGFFEGISNGKFTSIKDAVERGEEGDGEAKEFVEDMTRAAVGAARKLSEKNPDLNSEMYMGSDHIKGMMRKSFGGLARDVSVNYIGESEEMNQILNKVEVQRGSALEKILSPDQYKERLSGEITEAVKQITELTFSIEDSEYQEAVVAVLNGEKVSLLGEERTEEASGEPTPETETENSPMRHRRAERGTPEESEPLVPEADDGVPTTESEPGRHRRADERHRRAERGRASRGDEVEEGDSPYRFSRERSVDLSTPEKAYDVVNALLNKIEESSFLTEGLTPIYSTVNTLYDLTEDLRHKSDVVGYPLDKMNYSEVVLAVDSRLALHDTKMYMLKSDFKLGEKGLEAVEGAIEGANRVLNQSRLTFLIRNCRKMGIPLDMAIYEIQKSNLRYKEMLIEMKDSGRLTDSDILKLKIDDLELVDKESLTKGTTVEGLYKSHWWDKYIVRKEMVYDYLVQKVTEATGMDGKKAIEMAKDLMIASGEISLFNFNLDRNDTLCRAIHFGYFRKYYAAKGKIENVGPLSTIDNIPELTWGWFRHMSNKDGKLLEPLRAEDLIVENNDDADETKSFTSFYNKYIKHLNKAMTAILSFETDPKVVLKDGSNYLGLVVQSIDKIDPPNDLVNIPGLGCRKFITTYNYDYTTGTNGEENSVYSVEGLTGVPLKQPNGKIRLVYNGQVLELDIIKSRGGDLELRANLGLGLLESIATRAYEQWSGYSVNNLEREFVEMNLSSSKPLYNKTMWSWAMSQTVAHVRRSWPWRLWKGDFKDLNFNQAFRRNQKGVSRKEQLESLGKVIQSGKV